MPPCRCWPTQAWPSGQTPLPARRAGGRRATLILRPDTTCFKTYETLGDEDEDGEEDGGGDTAKQPTKPIGPCANPLVDEGFVASEACSTTPKPPMMDGPNDSDPPEGHDASGEVSEHGGDEVGGFADPDYKDDDNPFREHE